MLVPSARPAVIVTVVMTMMMTMMMMRKKKMMMTMMMMMMKVTGGGGVSLISLAKYPVYDFTYCVNIGGSGQEARSGEKRK